MDTEHGYLTLSNYINNLSGYDASKLEKVKLDSEESYDKFFAYTFIQVTDLRRTVKLKEDLAN